MRTNKQQMKAVLFMALISLVFSQTALPTADPTPGLSATPTATPPAPSPTPTASPAAPSITATTTPSPSSASSPLPPSPSPTSSVVPASPSPTATPAAASATATPTAPSATGTPGVKPSVAKSPAPSSDTPQTPGSTGLLTPGSPESPASSGKTTDGSTMYHYAEFSSVINLSKFDSDYFNANFTTFGSGSYFDIFSSVDSSESSVLSPLVSLFLLALSVLAFFL